MLRFKPEVRIDVPSGALWAMLDTIALWSLQHRTEVQVNSIADPAANRVPTSLHPFTLAIDAEPIGNVEADRQSLADFLNKHLPANYDVVFESSHVHVEFDTHRGPLRQIAG